MLDIPITLVKDYLYITKERALNLLEEEYGRSYIVKNIQQKARQSQENII